MARSVKAKPTSLVAKVRRHTKRALVPHKANDYRPHLSRLSGVTVVLAIALLAQVIYGFATTGHFEILGRVSDIDTVELLADTNGERSKQGVAALTLNDQLAQAAFLKAQDMFTNNYWAHTSPTGVHPWKWLGDAGYNYSVAGENLAKNYPTADATVAAWMNSPTHRENVLNGKYSEVGFAVVEGTLEGRDTVLVVAFYGSPVTVAATQGATAASPTFTGSTVSGEGSNPLTYFGSAVQSLSPVTILILGLFAVVAIVGAAAHHYRDKLPKTWQRSWKLHHGMYTFWGMLALGALVIVATGGGQI